MGSKLYRYVFVMQREMSLEESKAPEKLIVWFMPGLLSCFVSIYSERPKMFGTRHECNKIWLCSWKRAARRIYVVYCFQNIYRSLRYHTLMSQTVSMSNTGNLYKFLCDLDLHDRESGVALDTIVLRSRAFTRHVIGSEVHICYYLFLKSFCVLLLPVYLYALSFTIYHQLSASMGQIRGIKKKKVEQDQKDFERDKSQ